MQILKHLQLWLSSQKFQFLLLVFVPIIESPYAGNAVYEEVFS